VKGYYLIGTLFLTMSCFVLQKTIRDNEEDNERFPKNKPLDKE
ncbi:YiaA/YiaB family inner membrane protein, partial [Enterobacter mori]